ncbi:glucan endo-1,3-beta-D-glucosidase [Mariniflexile gromovii]|uniref:Glucan endo-1,3-beta-D-glucosidase n=1 Tax=Mariniflexile gromovii TaxID=362523 RepID=A0ABS4BQN1_9FLAO|nr:glucan endo-1,3-beta-D-glucosidase [Mariniflexile gromovii]MBP0902894.1 glucan endo-1,3-beta-D-glucosidase [Mariniflexile gromovii]
MKNFKYITGVFLTFLMLFTSCQDDNVEFGDLTAPTNISVEVLYADGDQFVSQGPGDGTGVVNFVAQADNAISYQFVYNGSVSSAPGGKKGYSFAVLGLNTYSVTVLAFGRGGVSSSKTIEVEVLSTYSPPADLLTMLTANSSRTWRIKAEAKPHFGLGPVVAVTNAKQLKEEVDGFEYYSAGANEKAGTGMYDDRYTFNIDGTFTAVTNGTVFGREVLINELGGSGGTTDGADILNYTYNDYTAQWSLTAPGGIETISLTGLAFVGYYTGGNHQYIIYSRSENEMVLTTTDGNNGFNWWFTLVPE